MYTNLIFNFEKCGFTFVLFILISQELTQSFLVRDCDEILCSNVYDPVCGEAVALDGSRHIYKLHNICYLRFAQCQFINADINQISDEACEIIKPPIYSQNTRRLVDFSIVGAHQACNHTCPTFCLDTYDPACAQIWSRNMQSYVYRPMINHCHIDLYSCVVGVNVTIQPLIGKCYKNPTAINFMLNVASMKTLKLLDDPSPQPLRGRRFNLRPNVGSIIKKEIKHFLHNLGHRVQKIG